MKFRNFFLLFRVICFVLPDPDSKYGSGSTDLTSKHEISYFFLLLWVIFFVLPDPDFKYGSRSTDLIESRSNTDPDPQRWIFFVMLWELGRVIAVFCSGPNLLISFIGKAKAGHLAYIVSISGES